MAKLKYYVRIHREDEMRLTEYVTRNKIEFKHLGNEIGIAGASYLYMIIMDKLELLNLKLSFSLVGCFNFKNPIDKRNNK